MVEKILSFLVHLSIGNELSPNGTEEMVRINLKHTSSRLLNHDIQNQKIAIPVANSNRLFSISLFTRDRK